MRTGIPGTIVASFLPLIGSNIGHTTDNMRRSHRYNAAAHTPCVCDTPICAVLLWLVVFIGACRPYSAVCLTTGVRIFCIRTYPGLRTYLYHHHLSCCCFFCLLLRVIQHCHCSSCAQRSAPTTAAVSVLCACGRSALYSQHSVVFVVVIAALAYARTCCRA